MKKKTSVANRRYICWHHPVLDSGRFISRRFASSCNCEASSATFAEGVSPVGAVGAHKARPLILMSSGNSIRSRELNIIPGVGIGAVTALLVGHGE
ncbi:hypothetical protein AB4Y32_36750 [Paraburkholderia phymatum]|uniref:Uncharacterized protein n=1 Tax=Paraburkholderia phymatum TaxID=148447 RepID=A0ACC6UCP4_9BURK